MRVHVNQAVILKSYKVAGLFGLPSNDAYAVIQTQYALCKVKVVGVGFLPSQPHGDEDDDSSTVWHGGGRRWLVVLWGRRGI